MSNRPEYDALFGRILDGEDFRLERDNRLYWMGESYPMSSAVRLWMRSESGRWSKTPINLAANTEKGDPDTVASILRSYAAVLDHRQEEAS